MPLGAEQVGPAGPIWETWPMREPPREPPPVREPELSEGPYQRGPGRAGPRKAPLRGPARIAVALAIGLAAGVGVVGVRQLASGDGRPGDGSSISTPGQSEAAAGVRRATVGGALLQRFGQAVVRRDEAGFRDLIDPESPQFGEHAEQVFENLSKLPLGALSFRYVRDDINAFTPERRQELGGSEAWLAQVEVSWRLEKFDPKPARSTLPVTLVTRGPATYIASFSDRFVAGQRRPIWTLGELYVTEGEDSLVVSLDPDDDLDVYAGHADQAVASATDVWGTRWRRKVVVYLPETQAQMESVLGATKNSYTQIAAVTMAEIEQPQPSAPVRIVANPKLFGKLGKQGRRIVLTHETVHVASTATASPVPLWLAEGFADYVAFEAVNVSINSAAKELFKAVRAGKGPKKLPTPEMFAASSEQLVQAYEASWLACRLIAQREGEAQLVKFYRAVHGAKGSDGLAKAFRDVLDTTEKEFVEDWLRYLEREA